MTEKLQEVKRVSAEEKAPMASQLLQPKKQSSNLILIRLNPNQPDEQTNPQTYPIPYSNTQKFRYQQGQPPL